MSMLDTFVEQIKEYGTYIQKLEFADSTLEYYRMDATTMAVICKTPTGEIEGAKFFKNTAL